MPDTHLHLTACCPYYLHYSSLMMQIWWMYSSTWIDKQHAYRLVLGAAGPVGITSVAGASIGWGRQLQVMVSVPQQSVGVDGGCTHVSAG